MSHSSLGILHESNPKQNEERKSTPYMKRTIGRHENSYRNTKHEASDSIDTMSNKSTNIDSESLMKAVEGEKCNVEPLENTISEVNILEIGEEETKLERTTGNHATENMNKQDAANLVMETPIKKLPNRMDPFSRGLESLSKGFLVRVNESILRRSDGGMTDSPSEEDDFIDSEHFGLDGFLVRNEMCFINDYRQFSDDALFVSNSSIHRISIPTNEDQRIKNLENKVAMANREAIKNGRTANVHFADVVVDGIPYIICVAVEKIEPGMELLTDYGDNFWISLCERIENEIIARQQSLPIRDTHYTGKNVWNDYGIWRHVSEQVENDMKRLGRTNKRIRCDTDSYDSGQESICSEWQAPVPRPVGATMRGSMPAITGHWWPSAPNDVVLQLMRENNTLRHSMVRKPRIITLLKGKKEAK